MAGIEGEGRRFEPTPHHSKQQEPTQPQQGSPANDPLSKMWEKIGDRQATFRCILPEITIPPVHLRPMLRKGSVTGEQAQEFEQEWREELKTWDRQRLAEAVRDCEEERDGLATRKKQEQVQDIEYQLEIMREQLRQRER